MAIITSDSSCPIRAAFFLMTVLPLVATAQIGAHAGDKTAAIPFDQIGSIAGRRYNGDGLAVTPTEDGARLRCVFQKLEGQATNEGLWLTSTEKASPGTRFRVIARAIGRGSAAQAALPAGGIVTTQGGVARFVRPGVDEEYSVSMDGLRQDFLILERPTGDGELRLELDVAGARAEPLTHGARLVLDGSGRKIAYSRLRATDAQGRDLPARIEVDSASRLTVIVDDADATYPLRIDPTFSDADWVSMGLDSSICGTDDYVTAAVVDAWGNLYIGGSFGCVGDVVANRVAKWDGTSWSALGSGMGGWHVYALAVSGSNVYAGGAFWTAGGSPANHIARWDGANWSALGSGFSVAVDALVVRGSHVYVGSVNMGYIGEWDGVEWSGLGSGVDHGVNALAISGSNLYVGGSFGTAGGKFSPCVAKANLPSGPEITVQDQWPWGWDVIADGTAWEDFDEEWVGASNTLTFTVHNTGTKNLTGLSVGKDGDNSGAFTVGALGAVELAPGENTTFDVTFAPSASGEHTAVIHIWSNDEDENPFDIALAGTGVVPVANVMVWQRVGTKVFDVYYDLAGTNLPLTIAVEVSTNNGASYELDVGGFSGELGVGVAPGAGRHVVWDAGTDWDGRFSPTMRFRITACEPAPEGFGLIPPRVFQMGDGFSEGGVGELPVHAACVGGFCMGATEVTKAQWDEVRAWGSTNGYTDLPEGGGKGPEHPVHTLSWYEALKWCNARSEKEGLNPCYAVGGATYRAGTNEPACDWEADGYRLPTEAEWEKAARGGVAGRRFPFGDTISHTQANYFAVTNGVPSYDVSPTPRYHPDFSKAGEIKPYTGPVTNFSANGCGLYGMADNVWEWCWDYYGADYYAISPLTDPHGPASGLKRLARGGCWDSGADSCRTAFRNNRAADEAVHYNGLRVARKAAIASESSNTLAADTRGDGLLPAAEDFDGDGCSNGEESLAGTDPRDPRSRFEVAEWSAAPNAGGTGITCSVMWASVEGRVYRLERSFDLLHWETIADDIDPTPPQNFINDEIIPAPAKVFYRMVVK